MKELAGSAANTFFLPHEDDGIVARVEVVLLHSEVTYLPSVEGMRKDRSLETFRFVASVKQLTELATHFTAMAEAAMKQEAEIRGLAEDKEPT